MSEPVIVASYPPVDESEIIHDSDDVTSYEIDKKTIVLKQALKELRNELQNSRNPNQYNRYIDEYFLGDDCIYCRVVKIKTKKDDNDIPKSDLPKDKTPKDDLPKDDVPINDVPEGNIPKDDVLTSNVPKDDVSKDDVPKDDIPNDDVPKDDIPKNDVSKDDVPKVCFSKDDVPKNYVPNDDVPKKDVPDYDFSDDDISNPETIIEYNKQLKTLEDKCENFLLRNKEYPYRVKFENVDRVPPFIFYFLQIYLLEKNQCREIITKKTDTYFVN